MKAAIARAEARIDGHDTQLKGAFKRIEVVEEKVDRLGTVVTRASTINAVITPVMTALVIYFMTR